MIEEFVFDYNRTPFHILQESRRSGTFQTVSARILQVSYIPDKPVRFWQIRFFSCRFRGFLQDSLMDLARQSLKIE